MTRIVEFNGTVDLSVTIRIPITFSLSMLGGPEGDDETAGGPDLNVTRARVGELLAGVRDLVEEIGLGGDILVRLGSPIPRERGRCRVCGCTDTAACPDGCGWANEAETLCTSCVMQLSDDAAEEEPAEPDPRDADPGRCRECDDPFCHGCCSDEDDDQDEGEAPEEDPPAP